MKDSPRPSKKKTPRGHTHYHTVPALLADPLTHKVVKLNTSQREAVAAIKRHGPTSIAAQAAGLSPSSISKTYKLPAVQEYLRQHLEAAGATHCKIAQRIAEGLDATTQKEAFDKSGRLLKGTERPDYTERREAARLALRLQGLDTVDKEDNNTVTNTSIYNIVLAARTARGLEAAAAQPVDAQILPAEVVPVFTEKAPSVPQVAPAPPPIAAELSNFVPESVPEIPEPTRRKWKKV